ncbi:MAG: sigma-70 family RNA polymerase sigma factor [Planctomycetota bacterium]
MPEAPATGSDESSFDAVGTAILLIGDSEAEVEEGFRRVYERFRKPLLSYIGKFGFGYHDRRDVLQEVMVSLCRKVRDKTFNPDKSLDGLMFTLAERRAVDRLRRRSARPKSESYSSDNDEDTLADLGAYLADTNAGRVYGGLTPAEKEECLVLIRQAIAELPPRERLVMELKALYPHELLEKLRTRASRATGEELTYIAMKKAVRRASGKVAEVLARKGYSRKGTQ